MTHFVCVRVGPCWPEEYVHRLRDGISRNFSSPHTFMVIGDKNTTLKEPPSWWHKTQVFRGDLWPDGETVFYMDLDTVVIGPLDALAKRVGFNMIQWREPRWYPFNSSVMIFPAGTLPHLSKPPHGPVTRSAIYPKGDQEFIAEKAGVPITPISHDEVASYKRDNWEFGPALAEAESLTASILAFHGRPRPHELPESSWAYKKWIGETV